MKQKLPTRNTLRHLATTLALAALVLFAPTVWGQTVVTIGDGTSTSRNVPIGNYYNYSITEMLYTADEIGMAGTITSISFYYSGPAKDFPITVYMQNVDATDLSSSGISLADADEVFAGTYSVTATAGWYTINLDSPFSYDGTSNLLIGINKGYVYYYSDYPWYCTTTSSTMARYTENDGNSYTTSTVPGTTSSVRPNIQIAITPSSGPTCQRPETLVASGITTNQATLTWTAGSGTYNIEYKTASATDWTVYASNVTGYTTTLTGLTPATTYNVRVQSVCGSDLSGWRSANFTTSCGAITTFPWSVDFESYASGNFSDPCWVNQHITGSGTYVFKVYTSSMGGNSTHQLQLPDMAIGTQTMLRLPEMTFSGDDYQFVLDIYRSGSTYNSSYAQEGIHVFASADGTLENATEITFIPRHYEVSSTLIPAETAQGWYTYELPIPITTGTCYIILRGESQYCTSTYMDNFVVRVAPTCLTPTGVNVSNVTAREADVNWTSADNLFDVAYKAASETDWDNATVITNVTTTSYHIAGLTPETAYQVRTRTNCGTDGYSEWTTPVNFTTTIACPAPTGLQVTAAPRTADVSWTSSATNFVLEYKPTTETDWDNATVVNNITTNSYQITGLTPETAYDVRVKADCGSVDGQSQYVTGSFTTLVACPAPTNLTATLTPGNGTVATLSWTEPGTATAWTLQYGQDDEFNDGSYTSVNVSSTPTANLTGLTAEQTYYARVKAVCGGDDGESNWSTTISFTPTDSYTITINDGTTTNGYVPIYGYYVDDHTHSKFIIPAADLASLQWGTIDKLTFYASQNNVSWGNAQFTVYMTETTETTLTELGDYSGMTQVMSAGTLSINNNIMEVTLTDPYLYQGGNLMIAFDQPTSGTYVSSTWYGVTATGASVGGYGETNNVSQQNFLPKMTINYTPGVQPTCFRPTQVAVNYTGGTDATISWTSEATAWNLDVNGTVTTITDNPHTLTGLSLATTYTIMLQSDCGADGTSDWTSPVNFTTDLCMPADMCEITYSLTDQYDDSWNGASIDVIDALTGAVIASITMPNVVGPYEGSFSVCDGRDLQFQWTNGSYPNECACVFTDANNEEIFSFAESGHPDEGTFATYTVDCGLGTCARPNQLTATNPGAHSIDLAWNERGTATQWQICLDGDETNLTLVNTNPYTLTGLASETTYSVKVRAYCATDDQSGWSNVVTFTTDVACPAPTNVTANHVLATTADISWTDNNDATSYNLRYAVNTGQDFFDDFENGMGQWTLIVNAEGTGWQAFDATQFSGGSNYSGNYVAMARSYEGGEDITADNWMISPQLTIGNSMTYWAMNDGRSDHLYDETYDVCVSTSTNNPNDFVIVQTFTTTPNAWDQITIDLSAYAGQQGYVAFHHHDAEKDVLLIDDVTIFASATDIVWTTVNNVTSPYTIEGLTPETTYVAEVQAVYAEGVSTWTPTTFTTLAIDAVPFNLTADVYPTTASLNWEGVQDSYNVRYRRNPVYYFTPFNTDEDRAGWTYSSAIYGLDDPVYNVPGSSNYFLSMGWNTTEEDFIYSPELPAYPSGSTLEFHHFYYSTANTFQFGYSTTTDDATAFTWSGAISSVSADDAYSALYSQVLPDGVKYIAFKATASEQAACIFIDNVKIYDAAATTVWNNTVTNVNATTLDITGLTPNTEYEWQAQGLDYDGLGSNTDWSEIATFTTPEFRAEANKWYAIASPKHDDGSIDEYESLANITNLLPTSAGAFAYDLFRYNEATSTWENQQNTVHTDFDVFEQARGYIYRRDNTAGITFVGEPNTGNISIDLTADADGDMQGFNLVGNPYYHTYTLNERCYSLTTDGSWEVHPTSYDLAIAEAVMVNTTTARTLTFTENTSSKGSHTAAPALAFTVKGGGLQDVAYASLTEGDGMPKLSHFNENTPVLSIPVNGRRYAIADLGTDCQTFDMTFRGIEGEYTLTLNANRLTLKYCHLIDRATGKDIDLLSNNSYTFTHSNTSTISDRFQVRLTPNVDENTTGNFAYWNGNAWVVEGTGTLEVYDVVGRRVFTGNVNSQLSILNSQFPTTGVYVLRMGDKNQKIVVR